MQFIQQGHVYRSADPRLAANGHVNDRVVLRINLPGGDVMYDGPAVSRRRGRYPRCRLDAFKAWAALDVSELLQGTWQRGLDDDAHQRRLIEARNTVPAAGTPLPEEAPDVTLVNASGGTITMGADATVTLDGMSLSPAGWIAGADLVKGAAIVDLRGPA